MSAATPAQARRPARAAEAADDDPLASCDFSSGELRGTTLSLYPANLVHSGADFSESMRLDHVGALRIGFERDFGRMTRGGLLLVAAVLVLAVFRPLQGLVASALGELTSQQPGGSAFLIGALHAIDFAVGLLPVLAAGFVLWAATGLAFGWIGSTALVVVIAPSERVFRTRGRNEALFEFAGRIDARLDERARG